MQKRGINSDIERLINLPIVVDALFLKDHFSDLKNPKKKIFDLTQKGFLHQIKRGQYLNLKSRNSFDTPPELIANSLYFPSYISLEWALSHYGLIPERVTSITSVTTRKSKIFQTPLFRFSYEHLLKKRYPVGYTTLNIDSNLCYLIARPEKALLDYIGIRAKNLIIENESDIRLFFEDDVRLNLSEFFKLVPTQHLIELLPYYHRNSNEHRILKWLISEKDGTHA